MCVALLELVALSLLGISNSPMVESGLPLLDFLETKMLRLWIGSNHLVQSKILLVPAKS